MNDANAGNYNKSGQRRSLNAQPPGYAAASPPPDPSWAPQLSDNDAREIDQFASALYQQYQVERPASPGGPPSYGGPSMGHHHPGAAHYGTTTPGGYPPAPASDLDSAVHTALGTPSLPSNDADLDYFTYSSFSVPSSRIDHVYPTDPTQPPSFHHQHHQSLQHPPPPPESLLKRRLSPSHQTAPLTPPIAKPKSNKHQAKPQKPKPVRQNSFPLISKSKVTKASSPFPESAMSSYFEFDAGPDYRPSDPSSQPSKDAAATTAASTDFSGLYPPPSGFRDAQAPAKPAPRPRGRPKKSKHPGFYIKLDNLNQKPPNNHSSSSVDSLFGHKHSSSLNLVSSKQFGAMPQHKDTEDESVRSDLRILEPDLGYDGADLQRFVSTNSNMTPSMKPPGTTQNGYFEDPALSGSFLSPHINYNGQDFNNFNKNFEEYLVQPKSETHSATDFKVDTRNQYQAAPDPNTDNHPDLSGYNFDVNPNELLPSPTGLFKPSGFEEGVNHIQRHEHHGPNYSEEPVDNSGTADEGSDNEQELLDPNQALQQGYSPVSNSSYENHPLERSTSHQSNNSVSSKDTATEVVGPDGIKRKKKRNPKGAICPICNKHISRDLTRHLRIHNEVGRFQCVYPRYMCNHKTQYFNRPYDYKKHLLHIHFKFDDPKGKLSHTLTDKLPLTGSCTACGARFVGKDWLDEHVLTNDASKRCPHVMTG